MKKLSILCCALLGASALTAGAVTPLWLRDVAVSPDGSWIAFTYKGDIYKVASRGGSAVRLTSQPSYESSPVWSPDGASIAFASDRNGNADIFMMPAAGGAARQLTFNSASETPEAFSADGSKVIYSAAIQAPAASVQFPSRRLSQLYEVPVGGGAPRQILGTPAVNIDLLPDGSGAYVYEDVKGMEDKWRKHHTSSVTRDIWLYTPSTGKHVNLTAHAGEDLSPAVSPDGSTLYFLSERDGGSANVYSMALASPGSTPTALTSFTRHPVRFLTVASDGTMAFAWDGEIYTLRPGEKQPSKVAVDIVIDDADPLKYLTASSAREAEVSPDGKQLAYVNRGELFVTSVEHPSVKQITRTPEGESCVSWGKDSRELYYVSERDGHYDIYRASIARPDDPDFSNATIVSEERVFADDGVDRTYPRLSPDGKKLAYVADRNRLMVMDLATKKSRQLTDGTTNPSRTKGFTAQWSPDSRMLLIENTRATHQPYSDISVVDATTGEIHDITRTGYFDQSPRWALDGNAVLFLSERYGMRNHASWGSMYDVMLAFLTKDAFDRFRLSSEDYALLKEVEKAQGKKKAAKKDDDADKKDKKDKKGKKGQKKTAVGDSNADAGEKAGADAVAYDFDGVEDRTVRLTPNSADIVDAWLTPDGETLYYLAAFEDDYDLWKTDVRKHETKLAKKGAGMGALQSVTDGDLFILGRSVKKFNLKNSSVSTVKLGGRFSVDPAREREYMLRHVYNEERERFYVKDMNGVDWEGLYNDYKRFLPHIDNNNDFAELLSELLGELNVSHTGGRYSGSSSNTATASLGLLYDMSWTGKGLKVAEVVTGGPFDRANTSVRPGTVITAIDGEPVTAENDFARLLESKAGKKTLVAFENDGNADEEVVLPITAGKFNGMLYRRWVEARERDVERWSGGRLGYVHLQSMSDDSFREIYAKVMGRYRDLDGIVIDTRWNGGGRLHEDIEVFFSAEPYLTQDIHGMVTSVMPSRRWTKPSIMVIGEANYSNAHGTPWVYKHKKMGKLVGMPVPGTMSSVNWVTLQDPSLVFGIPVIGFRTAEGNYLENTQLEPDVKVANDPADVVRGEDTQLRTAVETLLRDLDARKQ